MADLISGEVEYSPVPIEAKDGTLIPVETRVVRGNWNGRPVLFAVCKDIFGLKLSEEKFSKAFHGSPALMALIKVGNRTVFDVNEAFLRVLGYSRDEAIGKTPPSSICSSTSANGSAAGRASAGQANPQRRDSVARVSGIFAMAWCRPKCCLSRANRSFSSWWWTSPNASGSRKRSG